MNNWKYFIRGLIIIGVFAILIIIIFLASSPNLSSNESLLLGVLVSLLSIFISWYVTYSYSKINLEEVTSEVKKQHLNNLRTYAEKAVEKLYNLSYEMSRLKEHLTEIQARTNSIKNLNEENLILKENISFLIKMASTLKSLIDNSISDWDGAIGDKIKTQRALELDISKEMMALEKQQKLLNLDQSELVSKSEFDEVQKQIIEINQTLNNKILNLPFWVSSKIEDINSQRGTFGGIYREKGDKLTLFLSQNENAVKIKIKCFNCTFGKLRFHFNDFIGVDFGETKVIGKSNLLKDKTIKFKAVAQNMDENNIKIIHTIYEENGNSLSYTFPDDYTGTPQYNNSSQIIDYEFTVKFI